MLWVKLLNVPSYRKMTLRRRLLSSAREPTLKAVKELDAFPKVPETYQQTSATGGGGRSTFWKFSFSFQHFWCLKYLYEYKIPVQCEKYCTGIFDLLKCSFWTWILAIAMIKKLTEIIFIFSFSCHICIYCCTDYIGVSLLLANQTEIRLWGGQGIWAVSCCFFILFSNNKCNENKKKITSHSITWFLHLISKFLSLVLVGVPPITFTWMFEPRHNILPNVCTNVGKYVVTWLEHSRESNRRYPDHS